MKIAQSIAQSIDSLPTISSSVHQVMQLLDDPDASAKDFEEVIQTDPALAANLLRLANSAFMSRHGQVSTIRQAISMIGNNALYDIVTSAGFLQVIPEEIKGYDIQAHDFWRHCVAVAFIAQDLDRELNLNLPEPVFLAGLLHDVGKLVIGRFLQLHQAGVCSAAWKSQKSFIQLEVEVLGTDHCHVGAAISKLWKLPQSIQMAARWHHQPAEAPAEAQSLCTLVRLADSLAWMLGYGSAEGELRRFVSQDFLDELDIKNNLLEKVASQTHEKIYTMTGIWRDRKKCTTCTR